MSNPTHDSRPGKIAIIGAGNIGRKVFEDLCRGGMADHISLWNRSTLEGASKAEEDEFTAWKLGTDQASIASSHDGHTSQFDFPRGMEDAMKGAEIVLITAGTKRMPGMTRDDLAAANVPLMDQCAKAASHFAPNATYINITNPVDTLTEYFQKKSGIPANQIVGMSGELDRTRLVQSIAFQLNIPHERILNAGVIGQHGPAMVPVLSKIQIRQKDGGTKPLADCCSAAQLEEIRAATIKGGDILTKLRGVKGSDYIGPAAALTEMTTQVINARWKGKKAHPMYCSAHGADDVDVYIGRPVQFGRDGKYKLLPLPELSHAEQEKWKAAIEASRKATTLLPGYKVDISRTG